MLGSEDKNYALKKSCGTRVPTIKQPLKEKGGEKGNKGGHDYFGVR